MKNLTTWGVRALIGAIVVLGTAGVILAQTPATNTGCPEGGLFTANVSLQVLAPTPNEVIYDPGLALKVVAHGYELDDYHAGSPAQPCIGHYHEIIDGKIGNFFQGLIDMTPLNDPTRDMISMVGVTQGMHVLTLVPAENDHTVIWSKAVSIPFDYEGPSLLEPAGYMTGTPSITITSPESGSTVTGRAFMMTVSVENFVLCQDCFGKALVPGEGHWHVFEDNVDMAGMRQMSGTNTMTVPLLNYPPGWHTFYAVLTDNHHMPLVINNQMFMDSVKLLVR